MDLYPGRARSATAPRFLAYARLFGGGFLITFLVSSNTYQIAHSHVLAVGGFGFAISLLWFYNAKGAATSALPGASVVYALGAAVGNMVGTAVMTAWGAGRWI